MVITIRGDPYWLWRAVDNEGEVLDFLVQRRRNAKVAMTLMNEAPEEIRIRANPDRDRPNAVLSSSVPCDGAHRPP